jgi:hypothetical protein
MWPDIVISRAHREGSFCEVDHIADIRITILSSFLTDASLLSLMLFGVLRWKNAGLVGGIWGLMYTQVGIPIPMWLLLTVGLDTGHRD